MSPVLEHLRRRPGSSLDPTVGLWGDQDGGKDAGRRHVPSGVTRRGVSHRDGETEQQQRRESGWDTAASVTGIRREAAGKVTSAAEPGSKWGPGG